MLGGGGLMAAFPLAYAVLMPALYTPMIAMLLGLVFRGVAFEFRWRTQRERNRWDVAFAGGSLLATLAQGIALGALLQGIQVEGRAYAGGWWDWLTPFSMLTGVALVIGYALLGATWLVMKTEGELARRGLHAELVAAARDARRDRRGQPSRRRSSTSQYAQRWFAWPNIIAHRAGADRGRRRHRAAAAQPRQQAGLPAVLPDAGAVRAVPMPGSASACGPISCRSSITIWQAAAPENSQIFMLFGVAVLIPMILAYTAWAYWVFRGKVKPESGYH